MRNSAQQMHQVHPPNTGSPTGPDHAITAGRIAWAAILLLALAWRLIGITTTEVWRDEAATLIQSRGGWLDMILHLPLTEDTPPLTFLLFKAWSQMGDAEWFLRLLPVLLGTAWVDIIMRTARLIAPRAWWAAGLLAAFSHVPIHYSQELRVYALLTLLTALCLYSAQRVICDPASRRWLYALAGFGVLAGHAHLTGVFVFPCVATYLLLQSGRRLLNTAAVGPALLWGVAMIPMVWFARHWSIFHQTEMDDWWIPPLTVSRAAWLAGQYLSLETLGWFTAAWQAPWAMWLAFVGGRCVLLACLALAGIALYNPATRVRFLSLLAAAVAFLLCLIISGAISKPNIVDRTLLPAWSPVVLALSLGAASTVSPLARRIGIAAIVLVAAVWAPSWAWNAHASPRRPVNSPLFDRLRGQIRPQDLIYTWPRWYKEVTVYRLGDVISADQLLDEYDTYRGRPPRHRLALADPRAWRARIIRQIDDRRRRYGDDFSIWVVRGTLVGQLPPDSPEELIAGEFRDADRFEMYSADRPIGFIRYVPKPAPQSRPDPVEPRKRPMNPG